MDLFEKVSYLGIAAVILTAAPNCINAQTPAQVNICKKFNTLVETECPNLATEFTSKRAANTGLPLLSLDEPATDLQDLLAGIEASSFTNLLKGTAQGMLSPLLQTALDNAAQLIVTKAAINQTGANSVATASTNLVTKPTSTGLISLAAESGAFTDTVNGNTITAQANVDGLGRFLAGRQFVDLKPTAIDNLRHLNLTATFNVAQGGSTGVATSGTATAATPSISTVLLPANDVSFNSLSVNYALYRKYDPHSAKFSKAWTDALNDPTTTAQINTALKAAEAATSDLQSVRDTVNNNPKVAAARRQWNLAAIAEEKSPKPDFNRLVTNYETYLATYVTALLAADTNSAHIAAVNNALNALEVVNEGVLDKARGTPLVTLNYTYATPVSKPATHTATFVASYLFGNKRPFWDGTQLTANVAGSWFAAVPVGATYGSLQSFQFSAEADKPIGPSASPRAVLSVAGYGQYQYTGTVLNITAGNLAPGTNISLPSNAQVLLGVPGWLEVTQAKLVFNFGKGYSIPVAFKWSNKTDLVQQGDWKGQFGLTYDLSAVSSILSGKVSPGN